MFDLAAAQELFGKAGAYDRILVAGDLEQGPAGTAVSSAAADDRFDLEGLKSFVDILRTILLAFAGVALLVGAFTIFNALSIAIAQRTRELGLLRMVGASRRQVRRMVLLEALAIGLGASALGIGAGLLLAAGLESLFTSMGLSLPIAGMSLSGGTVIAAMIVGVGVTLVAALLPARRATKVAPVAALREAGDAVSRVRLPGRVLRWVTGLIGRPSARLGGSAGRLARTNAMRHPGRTAATASALLIGVALVTAVTVVAKGLEDVSAGSLERRVQATAVVASADGWTPIDPAVERAVAYAPGVTAVSSLAQDGALVFGEEEGVNAVDTATVNEVFAYDLKAGDEAAIAGLGFGGALVDDGWATEHGLGVGDAFTITSPNGTELDLSVRAIEESPVLDILGLGPITISREAFDGAFATERNRFTLVSGGDMAALDKALAAFPEARGLVQVAVHHQADRVDRPDPGRPLGPAGPGRDRVPVRDRQHAGARHLRAPARAGDAAGDGHVPPPAAPDGAPRERDHRAHGRPARHRCRARTRVRGGRRAGRVRAGVRDPDGRPRGGRGDRGAGGHGCGRAPGKASRPHRRAGRARLRVGE